MDAISARPEPTAPESQPAGHLLRSFGKTGQGWLVRSAGWLFETLSRRQAASSVLERPGWAPHPTEQEGYLSKPPLGFPRQTDSLCPKCVQEARSRVLDDTMQLEDFIHAHPGLLKAQIVERAGEVWMEKECPLHGRFEDILSTDVRFLSRIESLFPGRDYRADPSPLREHGPSSILYGRGSVLTVDLTNRCNMMCDPCFMDANQVGYVHELTFPEVQKILDDSLTIKPKRQLSVQFSGGEPTLHPAFLDSVRYARQLGYFSVQCATNGVRFAQEPEFALAAREAGLRLAYLQFDGVTNLANSHRKVSNLFDVKLRAIENLARAGIDVVLVVTVVGGINDDQVGPVVQFAIDNADKITVVSFQPVSFTGRDEDISDELRKKQRYTLSHLAHDLSRQTGITEPERDWFPLSAMNNFSNIVDMLQEPGAPFGALNCGCHPNCGIGTILLVNKRTKEVAPLADFLNIEQVLSDFQMLRQAGHSPAKLKALVGLSLLRNFKPQGAPEKYGLLELLQQALSQMGASGERVGATEGDASRFEWRFLFVAGMWFQDLYNYDFRRTEMCIIPYATPMGEISFCAYNTGVGFRQIVEKMYKTATVAEWFKTHGRHPVYARNQDLPLPEGSPNVFSRERRRLPLVGQL
jgi:7,8-dihydro-6-hydroxymethylpterin dimethyltransferase